MWGKHIDTEDLNQHWLAWENCQKQKLWGNGKDDTFADLKLIFFSCGHGYHYNCLEKIGELMIIVSFVGRSKDKYRE